VELKEDDEVEILTRVFAEKSEGKGIDVVIGASLNMLDTCFAIDPAMRPYLSSFLKKWLSELDKRH